MRKSYTTGCGHCTHAVQQTSFEQFGRYSRLLELVEIAIHDVVFVPQGLEPKIDLKHLRHD